MKYAIVVILIISATLVGLEELPGWPISTSTYTGTYFPSPIAAHIDRDGVREIIVAGPDDSLRVLRSDGSNFSGFPVGLTGNIRTHVALGDNLDMVLITEDGDLFAIDCSGNPVSPFDPYFIGDLPGPAGPVLWDFDGDSVVEIVVHAGDNLYVLKNDGSDFPGFPVAVPSDYGPAASPAVGDFTGDGTVEIIAVGYDKLYAFEHSGSSLFGFPVELPDSQAFSYSAPILLDFDGDDTLEICVGYHSIGGTNRGYIGVWDYNGNMVDGWPLGAAGYGSWVYGSPAAGDVDGDGLPEVAITSRNGRGYLLNENASAPDPWSISLGIGETESSPLLCDITGDGGPDILFLGNNSSGSITCLDAPGSVIDSFPFDTDTSWGLATPLIIDLEDDGILEICAVDVAGNIHLFSYPGESRSYAMPWTMGRHDPLRTGWLHPEPPDTVVVEAVGDSFLVKWSPVVSYWDFNGYYLYATYDESDSAGGVRLFGLDDTFATVLPDSGLDYFFVTANTWYNESERSMIAFVDTTSAVRETNLPEGFAVNVYPNPFNAACVISVGAIYELPLHIEIYDINGRLVGDRFTDSPIHQFTWMPKASLGSGIYLVRVQIGENTVTRRAVLLR